MSKIEKINLFECLLKVNLAEHKYRFNIPETILLDEDRVFVMLSSEKGIVSKKPIKKSEIFTLFEAAHETALNKVKSTISKEVYQEMY